MQIGYSLYAEGYQSYDLISPYFNYPWGDSMANVYQNAASYLTKKNAGKKRVPIGQVREILKDLCKQHREAASLTESYLVQLLKHAAPK